MVLDLLDNLCISICLRDAERFGIRRQSRRLWTEGSWLEESAPAQTWALENHYGSGLLAFAANTECQDCCRAARSIHSCRPVRGAWLATLLQATRRCTGSHSPVAHPSGRHATAVGSVRRFLRRWGSLHRCHLALSYCCWCCWRPCRQRQETSVMLDMIIQQWFLNKEIPNFHCSSRVSLLFGLGPTWSSQRLRGWRCWLSSHRAVGGKPSLCRKLAVRPDQKMMEGELCDWLLKRLVLFAQLMKKNKRERCPAEADALYRIWWVDTITHSCRNQTNHEQGPSRSLQPTKITAAPPCVRSTGPFCCGTLGLV